MRREGKPCAVERSSAEGLWHKGIALGPIGAAAQNRRGIGFSFSAINTRCEWQIGKGNIIRYHADN